MKKFSTERKVLVFWGVLDVIFIFWYVFNSINSGNTPLISDINMAIEASNNYGSNTPLYVTGLNIFLYLSIILSSVSLLFFSSFAKMVCYIQTPFRVFLIVPSLSLIEIVFSFTPNNPIWVIGLLFLVSEVFKIYSLSRKYPQKLKLEQNSLHKS